MSLEWKPGMTQKEMSDYCTARDNIGWRGVTTGYCLTCLAEYPTKEHFFQLIHKPDCEWNNKAVEERRLNFIAKHGPHIIVKDTHET